MATEETWCMATGEDDGKPLVFRIRNQAPAYASKAKFPHFIAVSWHYEPENESGMPSEQEFERMTQL